MKGRKVYSFSTSNERDEKIVSTVKRECEKKGLVFSKLLIKLITRHYEELKGGENDLQ